jgi:hypothetical protein
MLGVCSSGLTLRKGQFAVFKVYGQAYFCPVAATTHLALTTLYLQITSQEITADGLDVLGPFVATLADCEGLGAHANAVRIRLRQKKSSHT